MPVFFSEAQCSSYGTVRVHYWRTSWSRCCGRVTTDPGWEACAKKTRSWKKSSSSWIPPNNNNVGFNLNLIFCENFHSAWGGVLDVQTFRQSKLVKNDDGWILIFADYVKKGPKEWVVLCNNKWLGSPIIFYKKSSSKPPLWILILGIF